MRYSTFLKQHDLIFETLPKYWFDGAFLGNGLIGLLCYQDGKQFKMKLGRTDYEDEREDNNAWNDHCRLPIGDFVLETGSELLNGNMYLSLYDAILYVNLITQNGEVKLKIFVCSQENYISYEIICKNETAKMLFLPLKAESPVRSIAIEDYKNNKDKIDENFIAIIKKWIDKEHYIDAPKCEEYKYGNNTLAYEQFLVKGSSLTTAYFEDKIGNKTKGGIVCEFVKWSSSREIALEKLNKYSKISTKEHFKNHKRWWHKYYGISFLSVPDKWEGFYWIQMYKFASATREDCPILDNQGPWLVPTAWANVWFNLNAQLTYSFTNSSGRGCVGNSLYNSFDKYEKNLIANMPADMQDCAGFYTISTHDLISKWSPQSLGDFGWAMFLYYEYVNTECDEKREKERVFPLLKRAINTFFRFIKMGDDGKYHLIPTFSPEYSREYVEDCTYNLAILRMCLNAVLNICDKYGIKDPLINKWQDLKNHLTDYHVDENGYMIGKNMPFAKSHRHYSHLVQAFPFHLVDITNKNEYDLLKKSVDHWMSLPEFLQGYSYTGATSLYALLGDSEKAYNALEKFLYYINDTTLYREAVASHHVIETPLSCARSIQDLLFQSYNDTIYIFPAVPEQWKEAVFSDFCALGGFKVSGVYKDSKVKFIKIKSKRKSQVCKIKVNFKGVVKIIGGKILSIDEDVYTIKIYRTCILYVGDKDFKINQTLLPKEYLNFFGTKKKIMWDQFYDRYIDPISRK